MLLQPIEPIIAAMPSEYQAAIFSPKRDAKTAYIRMVFASCLRNKGYPFKAIARALRKKDHVTIMHACKEVDRLRRKNKRLDYYGHNAIYAAISELVNSIFEEKNE